MPNNKAVALLLAAASVQSVNAAENGLDELDFINDLPITFAATRLPQQLSAAPASVTIIDQAMIQASSATTVAELMRLVPGMQSYHIATNASAVSYHGMSDKFPPRMEVMIDGRSVYIPLFSAVIWETLPLSIDDIDRIEVVRGSNTVTQGSNAFLGAINIITHSAVDPRDNLVKAQYGEFDGKTFYGRYSNAHELGYFSLSSGITGNDGNAFSTGEIDPYYQRYLTFNGTFSPTLQDTITLNLGLNTGYSTVGDVTPSDEMHRREFDTSYQHISWSRQYSPDKELIISYSHSSTDLDARLMTAAETGLGADAQAFLDINAPYKITEETGLIEQHDIEISHRHHLSDNAQIVNGFTYRSASAKNRQLLDTLEWVNEERYRLFSNLEYSQNNLVYNLGLTAEKSNDNGTRISPRIAANYNISDTSSIRTSASRAYRMPSLLEANFQSTIYTPVGFAFPVYDYNFTKNENLKPARLDSIDFGLLTAWPEYDSSLDMRIFYEEITDGITENEIPSDELELIAVIKGKPHKVHLMDNTANWKNKGLELQYKYQSQTTWKPLLVLNYGYIETTGVRLESEVANKIDDLQTRNPSHTATALASITLPDNIQLSLSHYFLSSVRWIEAARNDGDPGNSAYHRTDLKVSKGFRLSEDNNLKISLIIQNLLDNPYSEFYAENIFEQRTYLQAQLSF